MENVSVFEKKKKTDMIDPEQIKCHTDPPRFIDNDYLTFLFITQSSLLSTGYTYITFFSKSIPFTVFCEFIFCSAHVEHTF